MFGIRRGATKTVKIAEQKRRERKTGTGHGEARDGINSIMLAFRGPQNEQS